MRKILCSMLVLLAGCCSLEDKQLIRNQQLNILVDNVDAYRKMLKACEKEACSEQLTNLIYTGYAYNLSNFAAYYESKSDDDFKVTVCHPISRNMKVSDEVLAVIDDNYAEIGCNVLISTQN